MKYSIGETVRIKATGEKVKIIGIWERYPLFEDEYYLNSHVGYTYKESELKPYRPSRAGKYRNKKGQFMSKNYKDVYSTNTYGETTVTRVYNSDSKKRNHQKIEKMEISPLESTWSRPLKEKINEIIDELGSRV